MKGALLAVVVIAVVLLAFGAFGWLGFAIGVIVVSIWWATDDEDWLP